MKPNNLWRAIIFNWPVKVFSLVLAIGIYLVVNYATLDQRKVDIPLQVVLPGGYEATSTILDSVTLVIRTDARHIGMIDPSVLTATADFSSVDSEGAHSVPILLSAPPSFFDVEVSFSTDPEGGRIYVAGIATTPTAQDAPGGVGQ